MILAELKTLQGMKPLVELLAASAASPETPYWLEHDEQGNSPADYCHACAKKVYAWLLGGEKPENLASHMDHPTWTDCTPENLTIMGGSSYESDLPRHCELCGCLLDVSILESGVEYEIEHWESCLKRDTPLTMLPADWMGLIDVISAIEYVEQPGYDAEDESRQLYQRTVAAVRGLLVAALPAKDRRARAWQRGFAAYPKMSPIKDEVIGDFWEAGWLAAELVDTDGIAV